MLDERDIVCFSSIDWDFIWQGHQEIMATFAAEGNRVLFVENTGVRSPTLRDLPRLRRRLRNWRRGVQGFRQERERLFVYSPLVLPFPYSRVARWVNRWLLLRAIRRWMRATGFRRPIVWTFLPTPLVRDLIGELDPHVTIYYCIDDLASSSPKAGKISRSEIALFRRADLVFVTSEKLGARASRFSGQVHRFPFGVDYPTFEAARESDVEEPADLSGLPRPIAGYIGGIHQWVDQELLAAVARRCPDVSVVLVGPTQTDCSRLASLPNVHLLGARPHAGLPRYLRHFDLGLIPYRLSDYTANVYPTKLNEYLAMGLPVVSTNLPEVRRFNEEHGRIVAVAEDAESFAGAMRRAVESRSPTDVARRIDVARQNSWAAKISEMSELVEKALLARRSDEATWEEKLRRLYRAARRRALRAFVGLAAAYVLLFHTPLIWALAAPLKIADPARRADAIVVFAGGVGESGKAGGGYQERVKQAVDLYQAGYAPRLIFSSGFSFTFKEAEMMKQLANALGVPDQAIILEENARSTHENVVFTRSILNREGWRRVLLVSSPYHMRRATWTFGKLAPEIELIAAPVPESQFYDHEVGASLEQIGGILHEYAAIGYYRWKGWL